MRLIHWLVGVPVAVAAVTFAVANRHAVTLELWPFPFSLAAPVYLAVLGPLVIGLVLGALLMWTMDWRWRHQARQGRRRAAQLEREVEALRSEHAQLPPPADRLPGQARQ